MFDICLNPLCRMKKIEDKSMLGILKIANKSFRLKIKRIIRSCTKALSLTKQRWKCYAISLLFIRKYFDLVNHSNHSLITTYFNVRH